jgi:hypothetical protein
MSDKQTSGPPQKSIQRFVGVILILLSVVFSALLFGLFSGGPAMTKSPDYFETPYPYVGLAVIFLGLVLIWMHPRDNNPVDP